MAGPSYGVKCKLGSVIFHGIGNDGDPYVVHEHLQ